MSADDDYDYTENEINKMFNGRIKPKNIFETYTSLSTNKFKFNDIDEKADSHANREMVEKIKDIRSRIEKFEEEEADDPNRGLTKKDTKILYEVKGSIIESPSYSYVDDDDKFYKIYAISLQRFEIEQVENMGKELLLFLAVVNELMREESIYHQKTYELVKRYNTIEKMITYIKDNEKYGSSNKVRFEKVGSLKKSCEELVKRIVKSEIEMEMEMEMENYKVIIPKIYETNMNEDGFYYDKNRIYYYMRMSKVPNTDTTKIQSIKECYQIKPMISVIDIFLIMNGISHNDYSTKGNVFADVPNKYIYIIDFGSSGDYVYNAGANVNLGTNVNSLNITCD